MININVTYTCETKEKRDELLNDLRPFGKECEKEPGNLQYHYYLDADDETKLFLLEQWESDEALKLHFDTDGFRRIGEIKEKHGAETAFSRITGECDGTR